MANKEIVVQKYGGESVADFEKMGKVARYIKKIVEGGKKVAVVVSAMGETTDELIQLAKEVSGPFPPKEELNKLLATGEEQAAPLLAMALIHLGLRATSFTSREIRLEADSTGRVKRVGNVEGIKALLEEGEVVVITGFQGVIEGTQRVITLGRGGSDLTAISLAATLGLDYCEKYTKEDGVYATDPEIVPNAKRLPKITYGQMCDLAEAGAKVLMSRAVDLAQDLGVKIKISKSPSIGESTGGTLVCAGGTLEEMEGLSWIQPAVAIQKGMLVVVSNIRNEPGTAATVFESLKDFNLMDSTQGIGKETASISPLCFPDDLPQILAKLNEVKESGVAGKIEISEGIPMAELTLVYPLMREGYLYRMFKAMARVRVNIELHSAPSTTISVTIREEGLKKAAQALAEEFKLRE